jgi:hypothetical protein
MRRFNPGFKRRGNVAGRRARLFAIRKPQLSGLITNARALARSRDWDDSE